MGKSAGHPCTRDSSVAFQQAVDSRLWNTPADGEKIYL